MKRTLWSLLVGAVAAVIPAVGAVRADAAPAPARAATAPIRAVEPGRIEESRPLLEAEQRDEREDAPLPAFAAPLSADAAPYRAPAIALPRRSPEVAPLSRRALGRPRVRAPTHAS